MATPETADSLASHCRELNSWERSDFRRRALRSLVRRHLLPGKTLDLGCGYGHLSLDLAGRGYPVTAVDASAEMIASLRARAQGLPLRAELLAAEAISRLSGGPFRNIVSLDMLEHVREDAGLLQALLRLLQRDGRLILVVPALPWLFGRRDVKLGHYRRYSRADLRRKIVSAGFTLETLRFWNATALIPYLVFEKVMQREISDAPRIAPGRGWRLAGALLAGLLHLEGRIPPPLGLSLFAVARKS
jgi:SAM-dependent methyltransferase